MLKLFPPSQVTPALKAAPREDGLLLFVDVDEVLLNFDDLMFEKAREHCIKLPPLSELLSRPHMRIRDSFPDIISADLEMDMLEKIFEGGGLSRQMPYPELDPAIVGEALSRPNVYMLTAIPEVYADERIARLNNLFPGAELTRERFLCSWARPKGEWVSGLCSHYGVDVSRSVLVDDTPAHIASVLSVGGSGMLVERSYNVEEGIRMQKTHSDDLHPVPAAHVDRAVEVVGSLSVKNDIKDRLRKIFQK